MRGSDQLLLHKSAIEGGVENLYDVRVPALGENVDFREKALETLLLIGLALHAHYLYGDVLLGFEVDREFYPTMLELKNGIGGRE